MNPPGAVVIGGYVNGLGVVRSLAARGVRVAVVSTQPFDIAQRSRHAAAHHPVPGAEPHALHELLDRRAPDWEGWALLPANDEAVEALALHHEELSARYRVLSPPPHVAPSFLDKGVMQEAARAVGAELPRVYARAEDVDEYPVLVKPLAGHRFAAEHGVKLRVASGPGEVGDTDGMQIVDRVPGDDSRIYAHCVYMDERGEPRGALTVRKLRQSPPFHGVARVAEIPRAAPDLHELTVELLRRIGHRGPAAAEFKVDPRDGRPKFLEVNGRAVLYNALLRRGGLDLAGMEWADRVEGRVHDARTERWPGTWVNLHADVLYALLRRREQRLGLRRFARPYARPLLEAVWSPSDPQPFLAQWGRTARTATRRA